MSCNTCSDHATGSTLGTSIFVRLVKGCLVLAYLFAPVDVVSILCITAASVTVLLQSNWVCYMLLEKSTKDH